MKLETVKINKNLTFNLHYDIDFYEELADIFPENISFISNHRDYRDIGKPRLSLDDIRESMPENVIPVYAYIHSGISLSLGEFNCPWDSGVFGFLVLENGVNRDELGLDGMIRSWQALLNGEVYGFTLETTKKCSLGCEHSEVLDSCWGFYGYKNRTELLKTMLDHTNLKPRQIKKVLGEI
jgi:hypothetical protein